MGDPALEVGSEVGMPGAVLGCGTVAQAVVENGLELVVLGTRDVGMAVEHDSGRLLANALAHHARLAVLDHKSLFQRNRRDMAGEPVDPACECFVSREDQVIGIARVASSRRSGQAIEAGVEAEGAEVGQGRRGRGPWGR